MNIYVELRNVLVELEKKNNRIEEELQLRTQQRDRALFYLESIEKVVCPPTAEAQCIPNQQYGEECRKCRRRYVMGTG